LTAGIVLPMVGVMNTVRTIIICCIPC